ncbi:MAG: hypothetical protein ABIK27_01230 [Bacteroidota bacterium]
MKKKLTVKPPTPNPKCCKTCLVQAACSLDSLSDCPEAWAEIMKIGSFVYWPGIIQFATREELKEDGYSDEDVEMFMKVSESIGDIRKGKLTIRPATKLDRNVVKFVITECS